MLRRPVRAALVLTLAAASIAGLATTAHALRRGQAAPALRGQSVNGRGAVDISRLRGKVVLVDFAAAWCAPCQEELPVLQRLYRRYKRHGLEVIGVSVDRDVSGARQLVERTGVRFPVVHDASHAIANAYEPSTMPSSFLIDRDGQVVYVHRGWEAGDGRKLERAIRRALQASPSAGASGSSMAGSMAPTMMSASE